MALKRLSKFFDDLRAPFASFDQASSAPTSAKAGQIVPSSQTTTMAQSGQEELQEPVVTKSSKKPASTKTGKIPLEPSPSFRMLRESSMKITRNRAPIIYRRHHHDFDGDGPDLESYSDGGNSGRLKQTSDEEGIDSAFEKVGFSICVFS